MTTRRMLVIAVVVLMAGSFMAVTLLGSNQQRAIGVTKARIEHPSAFEVYQDSGRVSSRSIERRIEKSDAVTLFEKCVDAIRTRERCTNLQALQKAACEYPDELAAYREA